MIELIGRSAGFGETIGDGVVRKRGVMFAPGKAFLLCGGDDPSLVDQRRGAVGLVSTNYNDPHRAG
jgi:hypothetical protein